MSGTNRDSIKSASFFDDLLFPKNGAENVKSTSALIPLASIFSRLNGN